MFRQEFEWLTSNTRIAYPFVDRVTDPVGSDGKPFSDLVVDAYLAYPADEVQDIRLYALSDPAAVSVSVEFRYADGSVAFNSIGSAFKKSTLGSWTLLEWMSTAGAARLLLLTEKIAQFTWPVAPDNAYLVGHTLQPIQSFVNTLTAEGHTYDGVIELISGYNVDLSVVPPLIEGTSARKRTQIQIDAEPGGGLGTYPDCEFEAPSIFTINGIGPDGQGNFLLNPVDCYRGQIPITNPLSGPPWRFLPNAFKLFNDCSPCCECEDYIYVYDELLRRVYELAKTVSDRFYKVRDDYRALYDKIEAQKACREKPRIDLKLVGRHGWCVAVQLIVFNNKGCQCDQISVDINMVGPNATTVPDSQRIDTDDIEHKPFALGGGWPNYTVTFTDGVRGARSLVAKFEVYFPIGARAQGMVVRADASGTVDGVAVSDSATTRLTQVFNKY